MLIWSHVIGSFKVHPGWYVIIPLSYKLANLKLLPPFKHYRHCCRLPILSSFIHNLLSFNGRSSCARGNINNYINIIKLTTFASLMILLNRRSPVATTPLLNPWGNSFLDQLIRQFVVCINENWRVFPNFQLQSPTKNPQMRGYTLLCLVFFLWLWQCYKWVYLINLSCSYHNWQLIYTKLIDRTCTCCIIYYYYQSLLVVVYFFCNEIAPRDLSHLCHSCSSLLGRIIQFLLLQRESWMAVRRLAETDTREE